jgi:hypothetical protein
MESTYHHNQSQRDSQCEFHHLLLMCAIPGIACELVVLEHAVKRNRSAKRVERRENSRRDCSLPLFDAFTQ